MELKLYTCPRCKKKLVKVKGRTVIALRDFGTKPHLCQLTPYERVKLHRSHPDMRAKYNAYQNKNRWKWKNRKKVDAT